MFGYLSGVFTLLNDLVKVFVGQVRTWLVDSLYENYAGKLKF